MSNPNKHSLPDSVGRRFDEPERDQIREVWELSGSLQDSVTPGETNRALADLEIRLDLINLLNRKNAVDQYLNPVFDGQEMVGHEDAYRTFPGFYPSVSVSASF